MLLVILMAYGLVLSLALGLAGHRSRRMTSSEAAGRSLRRVLVIGATGGTGRQLVTQALERGYRVTAFVRDPGKLRIQDPRLTVRQGNVLDVAAVTAAVRGQEAVLCALGHKRYFGPSSILSQGTRNILRAMQAEGVDRLVCETSLGIGSSAGRMGPYYTFLVIPFILPFYFWDKTRQERLIASSSTEWVIVRPAALTHGTRRGFAHVEQGIRSFFWTLRIPRADVAAFMLEQLESNRHLRTAVGLS